VGNFRQDTKDDRVQASGAAPLVDAFLGGKETMVRWKNPETVASAIRIGNPVSWKKH